MKTNKIFSVAMAVVAMMAMTMTSCSKDDDATTDVAKTTVAQTKGMSGQLTVCVPVTDQMMNVLDLQLHITDEKGNIKISDIKPGDLKSYAQIKNINGLLDADGGEQLFEAFRDYGGNDDSATKVMYYVTETSVSQTPADLKMFVTYTKKENVDEKGTTDFMFATPTVTFTYKQNGVEHVSHALSNVPESRVFNAIGNKRIDEMLTILSGSNPSNRTISIKQNGILTVNPVK